MNGLSAAQRNYDRELPVSHEQKKAHFAAWHVDLFILELSRSEDPMLMLENAGINYDRDSAELMRNLARNWQNNAIAVNAIAGGQFYRLMKYAARRRFDDEQMAA